MRGVIVRAGPRGRARAGAGRHGRPGVGTARVGSRAGTPAGAPHRRSPPAPPAGAPRSPPPVLGCTHVGVCNAVVLIGCAALSQQMASVRTTAAGLGSRCAAWQARPNPRVFAFSGRIWRSVRTSGSSHAAVLQQARDCSANAAMRGAQHTVSICGQRELFLP